MYTNNAFYGNHLTAEAVSETEAYIYQYYPNGYIANIHSQLVQIPVLKNRNS